MTPIESSDIIQTQFLDVIPLWLVYVLSVAALLLASELGYWLSRLLQRYRPDKAEANVGAVNAATLGLLAFLLAFVAGSAVNNFGERRQAVVREANAIGTAWLRAGYLPEPTASESRALYREYVDQRLAALDVDKLAEAIARSEEIHGQLWRRAEELARESPTPTIALYISSLNEVIDLHTDRINVALVARLPDGLVYGLFFMAVIALALLGLHAGYAGTRNPLALLAFVSILAAVFLLILDLNRGQEGLLQVSQQAMIDLQRQFAAGP
jgi:hypothetical protein